MMFRSQDTMEMDFYGGHFENQNGGRIPLSDVLDPPIFGISMLKNPYIPNLILSAGSEHLGQYSTVRSQVNELNLGWAKTTFYLYLTSD